MLLPNIRTVVRAYLLSFVFWFGFAPMFAIEHHLQYAPHSKFTDILISDLVRCGTFALLTPVIFFICELYPITTKEVGRRIFAYTLGAIPFVLAYSVIRWAILPPFDPVMQQFEPRSSTTLLNIIMYRFATQVWTYLTVIAAANAFAYFRRVHRQELEQAELEQALATSELHVLKSQLQPHFLFNTLHSISSLIEFDGRRAKAMVIKLSSLLRATLEHQSLELIPLSKEMNFVEAYLELEKVRLGDRLEVRWNVPPELGQMLVPDLVLQPLIENAVVHGIANSRHGGWIEIRGQRDGDVLELRIQNTVGPKRESGLGIGLQNTRDRLRYVYSTEAAFSFALSDDRTLATATIRVPALAAQASTSQSRVSEAVNR